VYGDWKGDGNSGMVWSVSETGLDLEHTTPAGFVGMSRALRLFVRSKTFPQSDPRGYMPSRRSSLDYSVHCNGNELLLRPAEYSEAYETDEDEPVSKVPSTRCSCPARAVFETAVKDGATCVIPVSGPSIQSSPKRNAVTGLLNGLMAFMRIEGAE
jgi:hypothetical protein